MNGGGVVLQVVDDGDFDHVAPVGLDDRSWDLSIDSQGDLWSGTIVGHGGVVNCQGVPDGTTGLESIGVNVGGDILTTAPLGSIGGVVAEVGAVSCWSIGWASGEGSRAARGCRCGLGCRRASGASCVVAIWWGRPGAGGT